MAIKILQTVLLAFFKYLFTLFYVLLIGLDYEFAILSLLFGGIGGFLFFYFLSNPVIFTLRKMRFYLCFLVSSLLRVKCASDKNKSQVKVFSNNTRNIVKFKSSYGMWGVIISTPFFLSVPLGAFLARRYYSRQKNFIFYMVLSFIGWAALYSGIIFLFPRIFVQ